MALHDALAAPSVHTAADTDQEEVGEPVGEGSPRARANRNGRRRRAPRERWPACMVFGVNASIFALLPAGSRRGLWARRECNGC